MCLASARTRRVMAACVVLVAAACGDLASGPTAPPALERYDASPARLTTLFDDSFDAFDATRWTAESYHTLGRGSFSPQNVRVDGGVLQLVHPAQTVDGGEIRSLQRFQYGAFAARMQTPRAPGTISALFLYEGRARSDELDIELYNDGSRRIMFTVWVGGSRKYNATRTLPFDPAEGFHDYGIEWSAGRVRFLVDGVLQQEWSHRKFIPSSAMYLMANAWWPTWQAGGPYPVEHATRIDRISATQ